MKKKAQIYLYWRNAQTVCPIRFRSGALLLQKVAE